MSTHIANKKISLAERTLSRLDGEGEFIAVTGLSFSLMFYLLGVLFNAPALAVASLIAMVAVGVVSTVAFFALKKRKPAGS